jgi:hypothetical protein
MLRGILQKAEDYQDFQHATDQIYKMMIERCRENIHSYFEIVALASHDQNVVEFMRQEYEKDIDAIESLTKSQIMKGNIRSDVDAKITSQLFYALFTAIAAKLVIGYESTESIKFGNNPFH